MISVTDPAQQEAPFSAQNSFLAEGTVVPSWPEHQKQAKAFLDEYFLNGRGNP